MARGKTIKLFLMEGEQSGIIKCSLDNWIGLIYKIPRMVIDQSENIQYLRQSGVYFLFGDGDDDQTVYIGQAGARKNGNGLLKRVEEPHDSIDWTEAIMITTKDNSLGPTEISYLENRFRNMAVKAGRYHVKNGNDPNPGNPTEEIESSLEEFIYYVQIVMSALGQKVFEPLKSDKKSNSSDKSLLYMEFKRGKATGVRVDDGFVILKGSTINPETTDSCPKSVLKAREQFADRINENFELTSDIKMTSASSAAGFVGGASLNGNILWHNLNGKTLKEIDDP